MERVTDLILGASKITTDGDYSHVIKRGWEGSWNCNTLATWWEELTYLKRPWCWERLKAKGEGDDREWDGCMASLTQWTWVWVNSESWWWTERPGMLQSIGLQWVRHDWATELKLQAQCSFDIHSKEKEDFEQRNGIVWFLWSGCLVGNWVKQGDEEALAWATGRIKLPLYKTAI